MYRPDKQNAPHNKEIMENVPNIFGSSAQKCVALCAYNILHLAWPILAIPLLLYYPPVSPVHEAALCIPSHLL
jgi:hypothetical protein